MFRKSTGETPHQFVLRQKIERAEAMLRDRAARVLDVAVACGFKPQQHFAQVFRDVCGVRLHRVSPGFFGLGSDFRFRDPLRSGSSYVALVSCRPQPLCPLDGLPFSKLC
jgi:AraC-like DNA-binding protein